MTANMYIYVCVYTYLSLSLYIYIWKGGGHAQQAAGVGGVYSAISYIRIYMKRYLDYLVEQTTPAGKCMPHVHV